MHYVVGFPSPIWLFFILNRWSIRNWHTYIKRFSKDILKIQINLDLTFWGVSFRWLVSNPTQRWPAFWTHHYVQNMYVGFWYILKLKVEDKWQNISLLFSLHFVSLQFLTVLFKVGHIGRLAQSFLNTFFLSAILTFHLKIVSI